jgi:hypothetical protein
VPNTGSSNIAHITATSSTLENPLHQNRRVERRHQPNHIGRNAIAFGLNVVIEAGQCKGEMVKGGAGFLKSVHIFPIDYSLLYTRLKLYAHRFQSRLNDLF